MAERVDRCFILELMEDTEDADFKEEDDDDGKAIMALRMPE